MRDERDRPGPRLGDLGAPSLSRVRRWLRPCSPVAPPPPGVPPSSHPISLNSLLSLAPSFLLPLPPFLSSLPIPPPQPQPLLISPTSLFLPLRPSISCDSLRPYDEHQRAGRNRPTSSASHELRNRHLQYGDSLAGVREGGVVPPELQPAVGSNVTMTAVQ